MLVQQVRHFRLLNNPMQVVMSLACITKQNNFIPVNGWGGNHWYGTTMSVHYKNSAA